MSIQLTSYRIIKGVQSRKITQHIREGKVDPITISGLTDRSVYVSYIIPITEEGGKRNWYLSIDKEDAQAIVRELLDIWSK
jgi:hypothetical protein